MLPSRCKMTGQVAFQLILPCLLEAEKAEASTSPTNIKPQNPLFVFLQPPNFVNSCNQSVTLVPA